MHKIAMTHSKMYRVSCEVMPLVFTMLSPRVSYKREQCGARVRKQERLGQGGVWGDARTIGGGVWGVFESKNDWGREVCGEMCGEVCISSKSVGTWDAFMERCTTASVCCEHVQQ
jgi:hypothetical protein